MPPPDSADGAMGSFQQRDNGSNSTDKGPETQANARLCPAAFVAITFLPMTIKVEISLSSHALQ